MSALMPAKLLKMKVLAEVPRSMYMDAPKCEDVRDDKKRQSFFRLLRNGDSSQPKAQPGAAKAKVTTYNLNAAVWMRFNEIPSQPVSLVLYFRDQKGEFAVMVDEAPVTAAKSVMLSGSVSFEARGELEFMRACAAGLREDQKVIVDELYVQKNAIEMASSATKYA